jgi:hypothetical protein
MSAHGFKSLFMAAGVAGAALGCYLVSLNVASERAKLEALESKIVLAQRDIRLLHTEIGTRGRLAQLERWNAGFIRLSAPTADQFLEGGFQLATMVKPAPKPAIDAPIVFAAAPADQGVGRKPSTSDGDEAKPQTVARVGAPSAQDMMRVASFEAPPKAPKSTALAPAKRARPAVRQASAKPKPAPAAGAAKGNKVASVDVLAPLPVAGANAKASRPDASPGPRKSKETGTPQ